MVSITKELPANNTLDRAVLLHPILGDRLFRSGVLFFRDDAPGRPDLFSEIGGRADMRDIRFRLQWRPPDLTDPIDAVWTDPNNARFSEDINTEQRALVTFSGVNAGLELLARYRLRKTRTRMGGLEEFPMRRCSRPPPIPITGVSILSNLINPFGPQTAAGQALINSSYINGDYQAGKMKRWSVDAHASHALGDAFDAGDPATVALGAIWKAKVSKSPPPPITSWSRPPPVLRPPPSMRVATYRRCSWSWTCRCPRASMSTSRIVRTATAISARPITAR